MSDLVRNPNCWFCHAQAHLEKLSVFQYNKYSQKLPPPSSILEGVKLICHKNLPLSYVMLCHVIHIVSLDVSLCVCFQLL